MYRSKRAKRDTAENIYRHCKLSGTCPPDVENKIENNTLADRLLRIFGSIIYLGGLGLGSGRGSGVTTGIRPLPENIPLPETVPEPDIIDVPEVVQPTVKPRPSKPSTFGVPLDTISSASNIPKVVRPTEPAIVPLSEGGLPDPALVDVNAGTGEGIGYEIYTDAAETLEATGGHPAVTSGETENIALLEITPLEQPTTRVIIETTNVDSGYTFIRTSAVPDPDFNVFVDTRYSGTTIGETIELQPLNRISDIEVLDSLQRTSTPSQSGQVTLRPRELYGRFIDQVSTRNPDFLARPSRAVQFEFENPAFQDDISLEFERDLRELAAAPDPAFTDIIRLGRPMYTETPSGNIRVSRLGLRGKISTRSGTVLTQKAHFYYDLSPIAISDPDVSDVIALETLGESPDQLTIVDGLGGGTLIDVFGDFSEDALLDIQDDVFREGHLEVFNNEEEELQVVPTLVENVTDRFFVDIQDAGVTVSFPTVDNTGDETTTMTDIVTPSIYLDPYGSDYYLHPSLIKKRKRKRIEMF